MTPVWLVAGSLSLGLPRVVLRVLVPLKCTWIPLLLHSLLNFSAVLLMYGTTMVVLWLVLLAGLLLLLLVLVGRAGCGGWVNLCSHWFNAQWGNWQRWRAVLMCESSFPSCFGWKTLFWPCVLGCCIHFVWLWCGGCCPSGELICMCRFPVDWSA